MHIEVRAPTIAIPITRKAQKATSHVSHTLPCVSSHGAYWEDQT